MNISIDGKNIGERNPCFIIAEVGSNHDRSFEKAVKLIDVAAEARANAIKFQLFKAEKIASSYVSDETKIDDKFAKYGSAVIDLYRKFELPPEWIPDLIQYCKEKKITFLATPFDHDSVDILEKNGIEAYKIASFELTYLSLIKHAASTGKPILLSTGMANLGEIEEAISAVEDTGNNRIALFHCNIGYPVLPEDVHLRNIETMKVAFGYPVGYYLPYWRPYEDYRTGYGAKKEMGGGIVLDASHEIDYVRMLAGEVDEVFAVCKKLSKLEIETEDFAEITMHHKNGTYSQIHLDYLQTNYRRSCEIIGDDGMIIWDINERNLKLFTLQDKEYHLYYEGLNASINDQYIEELKHLFRCIQGMEKPCVDIYEGRRIQEIIEKIKESSMEKKVLRV